MDSDCTRFLQERCCRSVRVWVEPARLVAAYRAWGGQGSDTDLLAALGAPLAWRSAGGLVCGVGLRADWGPEDDGERRSVTRSQDRG